MPLHAGARASGEGRAEAGVPSRFWVFAAFAVLYGICETMNGNWAQLDTTRQVGASTTQAALALTAFWAMVTTGRVLFALVQRRLPTRDTYRLLPFVLAAALLAVASLPRGTAAWGCWRSGWPAWAARRCCRSPSASARSSWW
jgi:fucose permease